MAGGCMDSFCSLFHYNTQRKVTIHSRRIGVLQRIIQILVICYIFLYTVIYEKGYQEYETVVSATSAKVKGTSYAQLPSGANTRIWDTPDYVVPPLENDAFFVTTRTVRTAKQTPGVCAESKLYPSAKCKSDSNCKKGEFVPNGNGVKTGTCNLTTKTCNINAWCPVESMSDSKISAEYFINNVMNFTVLIKNQIKFPKFGVKRRNIPTKMSQTYLQSCSYKENHKMDKYCPVFKIGDILNKTGETYNSIVSKGGFILINIQWNCDLDKSVEKCLPKYAFSRLDERAYVSPGWNYRYANYYNLNGKEVRDLIKVYGIRFIIDVTGEAGKFNFAELGKTIGSGLAYFGIAIIICDFITIRICDNKKDPKYREGIYHNIEDHDRCCTCTSKQSDEDDESPENMELNKL